MFTEITDLRSRRLLPSRDGVAPNVLARERLLAEGGPWFRCRWERALFLHYAVPAADLAPEVPFDLDLFEGRAFVSLVAFTMRDMRPTAGGRLGALLVRPIATHPFLNVRTYVRAAGEKGIFFLAEFLPNRLSVLLGPRLYGLPYRLGRLDYRHEHERRRIDGRVVARGGASISWSAAAEPDLDFAPAAPGSLDEFLVERFSAFTLRPTTQGGARHGFALLGRRRFRVWHPPWQIARLGARVEDRGLLATTGRWARRARFAGAHYATGFEAFMGAPRSLVEAPAGGA